MDTMQFYDKVNRLLKDRIERLNEEVLGGSPKDMETYKSLVAARRELLVTQDEIQAIYSRANEEDDDDSPITR